MKVYRWPGCRRFVVIEKHDPTQMLRVRWEDGSTGEMSKAAFLAHAKEDHPAPPPPLVRLGTMDLRDMRFFG